MVLKLEELSAFASYLENIKILKKSFNSSELIHMPRTHNSRVDSLACNAKESTVFCYSYGCGSCSLVCRVYVILFLLLIKKIYKIVANISPMLWYGT